ncbi:MAG: sulfatase [bacterium]|nr:sulfatase [bacterium]
MQYFAPIVLFVAALLPGQGAARPNIVLVLADDLGWTDLATGRTNEGNGSPYHVTPHLDALAAAGTCFPEAYSSAPNCAPTRAALWSGQWAARTGIYTVAGGNRGKARFRKLDAAENVRTLAPETVTLAELLKAAGYSTAHFGKWHLGNAKEGAGPRQQGFDHAAGGDHRGGVGGGRNFSDADGAFPFPGLAANGKPRQFMADRLTDEAIAWLKAATGPMFCCVSHYSVHTPIEAPKSAIDATGAPDPDARHRHRRYAAMVANLDANVGRLVEFLRTTKDPRNPDAFLLDNTLIVFTSDNGGLGGYAQAGIKGGQEITDQAPLRSGKGSLHEGGVRVPFIVRWDGRVAAGGTDRTPLQSLDLYPTLAAVAGADLPGGQPTDGTDLSKRLTASPVEAADRDLFWHFPGYLQANSKLGTWRTTPGSVIRRGRWKAIFWYETREWALYDLASDLNEAHDLADDEPERLRPLAGALRSWLARTRAPMPHEIGGAAVPLPAVPE